MPFTNTDLKSPRDLCLHLQAQVTPPFTKEDVETVIDNAKAYDGSPSPVAPDGAWAQQADLIDFVGTCKDY